MREDLCCTVCRKPLAAARRLSAKYCGKKCKARALANRRRAENLRQKIDLDRIIRAHEHWFAIFRRELLLSAPPEAGGYQLGLWTGEKLRWFPSMRKNQKYRHTLYGQRSRYGFFTLSPFEPPSVPLEAEYQVRFVQKIPPHFELPAIVKTWRKRVPYAIPCGPLPFRLRSIARDLR